MAKKVNIEINEATLVAYRKRVEKMKKVTNVLFFITLGLGVFDIFYLTFFQHVPWEEAVFRVMQYVGMMFVFAAPKLLRRFNIFVPISLSVVISVFAFGALVLGDGLDLYGRFTWWDSLLHTFSGALLSYIALWLIHFIMAHNDKYIYLNKYFLALFLVCFAVAMGACWEMIEFTYDHLFGTNTQQFMATTTGSIIGPDDQPLCGHEALIDSMVDLLLDLAGALLIAIYSILRHDRLKKNYALIQLVMKEGVK